MEYHPLSDFFPMLAPTDFDDLVEDIRKHGQLEPIVLYDGQVLDGRNRFEACKTIGIEPKYRKLSGGIKPLDYVISANLKRRQLTNEQKILILRRVYPSADKGGNQGNRSTERLTQPEIAKTANVSTMTVGRVDKAAKHKDLRDKMFTGDMTARQAEREYTRRAKKRQAEPTDKWRWTPEVVHVIDWIKNYRSKLKGFKESEVTGKLSPEAGRFIAERVKEMAKEYMDWASYLERKYDAKET